MQLPSLNGNWIDLIIIIFLLGFVISGIQQGFLTSLINLVGFLLSFTLALKFYPSAARLLIDNFSLSFGIANALGFIFLGFFTEVVFFIIIKFFYFSVPSQFQKSAFNKIYKILGFFPSLINGLVVVAFFLLVAIATPLDPKIKQAIFTSKLGSPLVIKAQTFEQEMSKIFGKAVLETLSFITVPPESLEKINLQFITTEVTIDEKSEEVMLNLLNQERERINLHKLTTDASLQEIARNHAKDMFSQGYFSHITPSGESPFDRLEKNNILFQAAGENLAYAPTVELAHQGLMQSPSHRTNILSSDFNKVGIGVIDGGIYGKMFVQLFTD